MIVKKTIKKAILMILGVILILLPMGCNTHEEQQKIDLVVLINVTEIFPSITNYEELLISEIEQVCRNGGSIMVISIEGHPRILYEKEIASIKGSYTKSTKDRIIVQNAKTIFDSIKKNAYATSEESDTLEALIMAANYLRSKQNKKDLRIYDVGVDTTGLLDQNEINYLDSDYDLVINELIRVSALPDLQQVDVEFYGLGSTTEQQDIPHSYQEKIKQFWLKIIEVGGGKAINTSAWTTPVLGCCSENLPNVTEVIFCKDQLIIDSKNNVILNEPIRLSEDSIKFKPNSDEFVDINIASQAIKPIFEYMSQNDEVIVVAGMTASIGSEKDCKALSLKRAEACRTELIDMGIDPTRIICIGLGRSNNCLRVVDTFEDGSLNEETAKNNRAIYVFSYDSEIAKKFSGEIEEAMKTL